MSYWIGYIIILLAGGGAGIGALVYIHRRGAGWRKGAENGLLLLLTLFFMFMLAEFYFKVVFAQTDGFSQTLANRNWFERYWVDNSLGYRDVEWPQEAIQNNTRVLVVGDSLAAGYGIEKVEDRFSNVLGQKLGQDYLVMNIASPGINTRQEIEKVMAFPYKPDILILQYYVNDIRNAAEERNAVFKLPKSEPWPIFKPLVEHSYALNFVYWRSVRLGPRAWHGAYLAWLQGAYNDPDIWWLHQQELLSLTQGAASEQVKLVVVVFPILTDLEGSRVITDKVVGFFREQGVPTVDVAALIPPDAPPEQLVVNPLDGHPNEWVHRQVAEALYEIVVELE